MTVPKGYLFVSAAMVPTLALVPLAVMPTFLAWPLYFPLAITGLPSQERFQLQHLPHLQYAVTTIFLAAEGGVLGAEVVAHPVRRAREKRMMA